MSASKIGALSTATLGLGSGGSKGQRGVGFLLHNRWKHFLFKPISDRLAALDLNPLKETKIRFMAAYFPHTGYSDDDVEALYASIEEECAEARIKRHRVVIAGDFNAEVGTCSELDDPTIIGKSSMSRRSHRGDMLLQWCTQHAYSLANTFDDADPDHAWTYRHGDIKNV